MSLSYDYLNKDGPLVFAFYSLQHVEKQVAQQKETRHMGDTFVMSSRLSAELDHGFERNGWTAADVKALASGDMLAKLLPILHGQAEVVVRKHIIDCDAAPFVPDGWSVEEHIKGGQFEWNAEQVELWLSEQQQGGTIVGNELRMQLKDRPVLNANALDYLLRPENQHLIPASWKGKAVFFWGTIYRNSVGSLVVRCLCWNGNEWYWDYDWLVFPRDDAYPAAVSTRN